MKSLIVANSVLSSKTAQFWQKHQHVIEHYLRDSDCIFPDVKNLKLPDDLSNYDVIVLIGDDKFFSCFIDATFYEVSPGKRQTCLAFVPDRQNSALANGLVLPFKLENQLELINKRQTVLLDVIRCHYIDKKGFPNSRVIINDALIGIAPGNLPLVLKTLAAIAKNPPLLPVRNTNKQIKLYNSGNILYEGGYVFSAVVLGNQLTDGPKLPRRNKLRCNLSGFDYYQLNTGMSQKLRNVFARLIVEEERTANKIYFSGSFSELIIKGEGADNTLIADGMYLGRLPATFTFLAKAIKVIAPILTVRVCQPWQKKVSATGMPKPIGSRNSLRSKTVM
jgi:hypothetical protein